MDKNIIRVANSIKDLGVFDTVEIVYKSTNRFVIISCAVMELSIKVKVTDSKEIFTDFLLEKSKAKDNSIDFAYAKSLCYKAQSIAEAIIRNRT